MFEISCRAGIFKETCRRIRPNPRSATLPVLLAWGAMLFPSTAHTQESGAEIRQLRAEVEALRGEVQSLREELRAFRSTATPDEKPTVADAEGLSPEEAVPLLQAQVAEQARSKVESNSRHPVRIFGTVITSAAVNTGEANWLDNPNLVAAAPSGLPSGSFSFSLRQSRLGAIVDGPTIGGFASRGFVAVDFFGGIPNFQTGPVMALPRLLYGFVRLERAGTAVEIGQDHVILAPRDPMSLAAASFPSLYRSGNLYLRAPQARVEQGIRLGAASEMKLTAGLVAPVGGDFSGDFQFVPPNLAGERSKTPAFQGRATWGSPGGARSDEGGWEIGVSGHYGRERFLPGIVPSWAASLDFDFQAGRIGASGEFFVGRNLDAFGGALGQMAKSAGGFLEARLRATQNLEFASGVGLDRPFDRDVFPVGLARNTGVFANAIYQFNPEVATSFEYRWLSTVPVTFTARRNHHLSFVLAYSF